MKKATNVVLSALPWVIIAGLLWAGLFVKPQPVGSSVQPPVLERRDSFYGAAPGRHGLLLIAGSDGKILRIEPGSGKIMRDKTPTSQTLQDIASWNGERAVAVGNDGVVLVNTTDGEAQWLQIDPAKVPRSEIANKLTRVKTAPGGVAVASGEMGALLISRDFGATWERLRDEEDLAWNDVALIDERTMVVVGEFGRILRSEDGGATWEEPASPVESSLMSVAFRDAENGVAVGLEGIVLSTHDGGHTWRQTDLGFHEHLFDVIWDGEGQRWVGTGALARWVMADAAAENWQTGRLDERDLSWHTGLVALNGQLWFAGANVGRWDGKSWQTIGG